MAPEGTELIVYRLDELKSNLAEVRECQREHKEELILLREAVAGLKVKAGIWGAIAGAIPAIGAAVYFLLK